MNFAQDVFFNAKSQKPVSDLWLLNLVAMETGRVILAIFVHPQNMHTLYIKYILLCWTRNKSL